MRLESVNELLSRMEGLKISVILFLYIYFSICFSFLKIEEDETGIWRFEFIIVKSTYTFKTLLGDFLGVKNGKIIFLVRHLTRVLFELI